MQTRTDWFMERKWGVFIHYLYPKKNYGRSSRFAPEVSWSDCVDCFDVESYAKTLHEIGAGYSVLTIMQGEKFMCAPNATFDEIAGTKPGEACSKRDLVMDLADELAKYDIPLLVYFTGDGPFRDEQSGKAFGYYDREEEWVTEEFVQKWSAVMKEYSLRYGSKVKGWWLDGMFKYFYPTDEFFHYYREAALAGNPDAIVAFNPGVTQADIDNPALEYIFKGETHPLKKVRLLEKALKEGDEAAKKAFRRDGVRYYTKYDDFLAGEENDFWCYPESRFIQGKQWHILSFLAINANGNPVWGNTGFGQYGSKYSGSEIREYVDRVNEKGGVVSIDIAIFRDGSFDKAQIEVLKALKTINRPDK